jgi:hypothetical protein
MTGIRAALDETAAARNNDPSECRIMAGLGPAIHVLKPVSALGPNGRPHQFTSGPNK